MPKSEPTKREKATAERKRLILETAVMCFIEAGYHQTGMRDIAKRAGVSIGNLYNHFGGKTDILSDIAAIERDELKPFLDMLEKDAPATDVLVAFIEAYTRHLSAPETIVLTLELTSESIRDDGIAELFMESRKALIKAISDLLERGAEEGSMRAIKRVDETSYLLLAIMESVAFRHGIESVPMAPLMENQLDFLLGSLARM